MVCQILSPILGLRLADQHCKIRLLPAISYPKQGLSSCAPLRKKPCGVSLPPRVHLAIVRPEMLRADMHQVFAEAKDHHYLVFITGPSRTADIELTVTLGVHGPKNLYVWIVEE